MLMMMVDFLLLKRMLVIDNVVLVLLILEGLVSRNMLSGCWGLCRLDWVVLRILLIWCIV